MPRLIAFIRRKNLKLNLSKYFFKFSKFSQSKSKYLAKLALPGHYRYVAFGNNARESSENVAPS
jgi:hypothetical protein